MIQRKTIYKRKIKGAFSLFIFAFFLFLGVFGACLGVWWVFASKIHILTPLPKVVAQNTLTDTASKIQNECVLAHVSCTNIKVNADQTATITMENNEEIILSLQKDIRMQIASLQLTIRALTIEGKRFSRIDFRFDKPVISY